MDYRSFYGRTGSFIRRTRARLVERTLVTLRFRPGLAAHTRNRIAGCVGGLPESNENSKDRIPFMIKT
ncbi:hypothetical protein VTI28DRAFT_2458 [Corynascus sepedonium]